MTTTPTTPATGWAEPVPPTFGPVGPVGPVRAVLGAPLRRRTWAELGYALLTLPLSVVGFCFVAAGLYASVLLGLLVVGAPVIVLAGLGARWLAGRTRLLANRMLDAGVPPPAPFRPRPGLLGWVRSGLVDGTAWRARLYLVVRLPVGIVATVPVLMFGAYGLGGLTYPAWRPFLPCGTTSDGLCHRGTQFTDSLVIDDWWQVALTALAGLVCLLAAPWLLHAVVGLDRRLIAALLGPGGGTAERVRELEASRALAVQDSAVALRRIERDLHDGTQARLVALAMKVGLAREKLDEPGDLSRARSLLDSAHSTAKEAIAELRDLVRGIHPPVLDLGLDQALATLAAHSPVPVAVRVELATRPAPEIETIAYFCVAELLTNVAKHSGARQAGVDVRQAGDVLRLQVGDDGRGGARVGAGSGLTGLADRVRTVDGRLTVHSPPGGPTTITVDLPAVRR